MRIACSHFVLYVEGVEQKKNQKQQKNKQTLQVAFADKTYQKNIANAKPGGAVHFDASP